MCTYCEEICSCECNKYSLVLLMGDSAGEIISCAECRHGVNYPSL